MKVILNVRSGGGKEYKVLRVTIPAEACAKMNIEEGQRYLVDLEEWELLE